MNAASSSELRIPLVIGITGHRDLRSEDIEALESQVKGLFKRLWSDYPSTPLVVLSPLAEGADRLVARVAVESGAELAVPLPLPLSEYEKDFPSEASRQEFTALLSQAKSRFELPLVDGATMDNIRELGPTRELQYEAVGIYIARHCHLLLALWDGQFDGKTGGTSEVVRLRLAGTALASSQSSAACGTHDVGPVCHIVTPRRSNPRPTGTPYNLRMFLPKCDHCEQFAGCKLIRDFERGQVPECFVTNLSDKALTDSLELTEQFNRNLCADCTRLDRDIVQSAEGLFPETEAASLEDELKLLRRRYAVADLLAMRFQKRRRISWVSLCMIGILCVALWSASKHLPGAQAQPASSLKQWLVWSYAAGITFGLALLWLVDHQKTFRFGQFRNRHLDYRALAEGLRIQFFWRMAGLTAEVVDQYKHNQRAQLEWIRRAVRAWSIPATQNSATARQDKITPRMALVSERWIANQLSYFERAKRTRQKGLFLTKWRSNIHFVFVFAAGQTMIAVMFALQMGEMPHPMSMLITVLMAIYGATILYADKMALADESKQFNSMARLFSRAEPQIDSALRKQDVTQAQAIVSELGRDALVESADWLLMHRDRRMEVKPQ